VEIEKVWKLKTGKKFGSLEVEVNLEMNYHQEDKEVFPSKSGNHLVVCGSR